MPMLLLRVRRHAFQYLRLAHCSLETPTFPGD
jgi:hypothetical protein